MFQHTYTKTLGDSIVQDKPLILVDYNYPETSAGYLKFTGPTLGRNPVSNNRVLPSPSLIKYRGDLWEELLGGGGGIIIIPLSLDAGFIIENVVLGFEVWNTKTVIATCTAIGYDPDSLGMLLAGAAPTYEIDPGETEVYVVTVYEEGAPEQSTIINFTIDGEVYPITVIGTRIVPIAYEPNWGDKISLEWVLETVVFQTERFVEQRRPLLEKPRRSETVTVREDNERAQRFWNLISYGKDKVYGIPIWHEVFWVVNASATDTVLTTAASIEKFWNLQNQCDYVMLYNFVDYTYEVKELASVTNTTITLVAGLSSTHDVNKTVLFPVFLGFVEQIKFSSNTFENTDAQVKFTEMF